MSEKNAWKKNRSQTLLRSMGQALNLKRRELLFERYSVHQGKKMGDTMEQLLNTYYANNARRLHEMVNKILFKFGGLPDGDQEDFYSLANEVFVDVMRRYNHEQPFEGFLFTCLSNKIKTEMTKRNRYKRRSDRMTVSIDTPVGDDEASTLGDLIEDHFDMDLEVKELCGECQNERIEQYLGSLSKIQRQIVEMKMDGIPVAEIKEKLGVSDKQYDSHFSEIKSFAKISILYSSEDADKLQEENDQMDSKLTQTMEKSKPDRLSIASIIKKIDKHTIRFDHALQRESEQWSPSMKGNLISDILQGNPIPPLVFAEQIVNGIAIIWDLDGKQRCTNAYSFQKDGYKITKNIRRWMIEYQAPVVDEAGNAVFDEENFPVYERREFDIRGKKFSELPEELQDRFNDYNFEIVQYLNCSGEDIAYHIARYNEGKPMTASQKGITRLGAEYAEMVKSISSMPFFKDMGGYKVSEFKNGTVNRVVVESVMAANFLQDWKKKQEDLCEYIKDNAAPADFDHFEDMVGRLEKVVGDDVSDMFDSRDSFLWFGLFARFIKTEKDDRKFTGFMKEFAQSLHCKKIKGTSFDDLNGKSTKDKNVVIAKMEHLEKLMNEYLGIGKKKVSGKNTELLSFVREHISQDITQEDVELYNEMLEDLTLYVDNNSHLLDKRNRPSLIAIIGYACSKDIDLDDWIVGFFDRNKEYITNQKENFLYMKTDLEKCMANTVQESA